MINVYFRMLPETFEYLLSFIGPNFKEKQRSTHDFFAKTVFIGIVETSYSRFF